MSLNRSRIRTHRAVLFLIIFAAAALGFGYFGGGPVRSVLAGHEGAARASFSVEPSAIGAVNVETPRSPWIKLREGKATGSEFTGTQTAIDRFEAGSLRPVSLASADVDGDGFPDLISGFSGPNGGVITIQRGAKQAFSPDDPQVLAGIRNGDFPASFEKDAFAADVPGSPDLIFTGRFLRDTTIDIAVAARGGNLIYIYPVSEKGTLGDAVTIDLGGSLTAAAADTFDPSKGFTGLVASVGGEGAASLVIFDGASDIRGSKGRRVAIAQPADSLILHSPDGLTPEKDLFMLGGGTISRLPAIGKAGSGIENIELPFTAVDFAAGEFIRDRRARTELAVLSDNGSIYYLANGTLDRRPFTEAEVRASFAKNGRGRTVIVDSTDTASALANDWSVAEQQDLGLFNLVRPNAQPLLRRAAITGNETDDLLVVDPSTNHAKVLFKEPVYGPNRLAFTGDTQVEDLGFASGIAAALPIRLNVMGQQGIAVLEDGKLEATPVLFAPQATFTVTKTADTADGVCNADCSLREAVVAANGAAGADLITFTPNGNFQLTIAGAGENGAATGDLDVTQSLTITGNGSGNSILQAGSTNTNGIDKVLSINPTFTSAFATSITGVTVRWGRNPSSYATDGFGGGFDWEGSGTGTLSVAGSIVNDNHTLDGDGGGITATNSFAGAGTFTMTGTTVSNNSPARVGAGNSPVGGGIFVGTTTPYLLSGTNVISGNNVNGSGGQGQGGGIFAFGPGGTGGNSFITATTITGNSAPSDAGGIYTTQRVDINPPSVISNNSSGRFGGGLFVNHANATSTIFQSAITGNSATTTGSGIYLGTTTTSNTLNISYSRIVGNTGAGLKGFATAGGTSTAENNWWGCNTISTSGPCDTTGTVAGVGSIDANPWLQLRLSAATNPIFVGQTSALTATFLQNSDGGTVSTGNIALLLGLPVTWGSTLGSISGSQGTIQINGNATATYTGTTAGAGTATATVDSGPAVANITVNKANTTTALGSSANPSVFGQSVTFTATVSVTAPGAGSPTGNVSFKDNGTNIGACAAQTVTANVATCTISSLSVASHPITAVYNGDANFNASPASNTVNQVVDQAGTTTSITSDSPDPSTNGQAVTVNYTVSVTSPGSGTPTGNVTVSDGVDQCVGTVAAGTCNITLNTLGARTLTATYAGDTNFSGSVSAGEPHQVNSADSVPPTAVATLTNVTSPGGTLYTFTVTYSDNVAVNVSTLDSNDIVVTGPNAFSTPATFVSVDVNTNGTPRVATYSFVPPGGTWDQADNGTYTVTMQANQVSDTNGNFVNGGSLGTFTAVPLVLVVDRTDDTVVSTCTAAANDCTLRGAIAAANAASTGDTINFDPAIFATPQTITLGGTEMVITNSGGLTINGPGADKLTINANGTSRVFTNSSGAATTISGMRLTGGTGTGAAGTGRGGAVYNTGGTLTLNSLVLTGNTSTNGAAATNATAPATMNVVNCWIYGNSTPGSGGAIQNFSGSTVVTNVINSSITGNTANSSTVGGGAIQANGTVTVTNSTIGGNTAVAGSGGGIYFNGTALTVTNSTIAGNTSANNGGGIHNSTANPPNVRNSIIAGNNGTATSPDVTSVYASNGNNIIGNVGTSTGWIGSDLQNTDPLLAPLGYYGGNGLSFALTSASPAVNGGQACVLTLTCSGPNPASAITLDQRGAARVGAVDIGSFELNSSANGGNFVAQLPSATTGTPYSFALTSANGTFAQTVTAGSLPANILLNVAAGTTLAGTPTLSGPYAFSITATGGANSNITDYQMTVFAATGSPVSVSGRVLNQNGSNVWRATVILTDSLNNSYYTSTSPLGYYRFDNIPAGATYTISQSSKRYQFTPIPITVNYNLTGVDLVFNTP